MANVPAVATAPFAPDALRARWQLWLVLGIVAFAAIIRVCGVMNLSFYGDEETTAFAAVSVLEQGKPSVPSGMDYNRAPLYSYMAAATASVLGEDRELSFRLPALVFGIGTILLLWFCTRRLLGVSVALLATALLATSEWHAVTSGYARMYAPYLALFTCTAYCFLEWSRTRAPSIILLAVVLFLLSASFQILTVFAVALLLLPHFVTHNLVYRHFWIDASIAAALAIGAIYLDGVLVQDAYSDFATSVSGLTKKTVLGNVALFWVPLLETLLQGAMLWIAAAALALCGYLLFRYLPKVTLPWSLSVSALALVATLFMVLGQVYALILCLYLLGIMATTHGLSVTRCILTAMPALAISLVTAGLSASTVGFSYIDYLTDPNAQVVFPYLAQLLVKYPVVVGAALLAPLLVGHRFGASSTARFRHGDVFTEQLIRTLALFFVLNLFAFGVFGRWYEDRYVVHTYPFMLVLASYTLVVMLDVLDSKTRKPLVNTTIVGLVLCLSMPHHLFQGSYRAAYRDHGDTNIENGRYFPDHASVGNFVRDRLQPDDVVVATDVLQQRWYVGRADYWLRNERDVQIYVYEGIDNRIRDIYVNAEYLSQDRAEALLEGNKRVWVIISSIDVEEDWAFSAKERTFLDAVKAQGPARFTGRDGRSAVYLVGGGS